MAGCTWRKCKFLWSVAGTFRDRVHDLVAGLAILSAEVHSLQRQQAALQLLLTVAHDRIKGVFSDDAYVQDAFKQLQQFATTSHDQIKSVLQLRIGAHDAITAQEGVTATPAEDSASSTASTEPASNLDDEVDDDGEDQSADSNSEVSDKERVQQNSGAEALIQITAGSAAVNIARAEHARAEKLAFKVARLHTEQADLRSQITALNSAAGIFFYHFPEVNF